ncbi:MAG: hypothetical protein FJ245_14225 [Nitrospira sp.]|nr:hypothetical protein [Nitrospira sp.]
MPSLTRLIRLTMDLERRERTRIIAEVMQVRGLMPLLMKPRNGQRWTRDDRLQIRSHVRRLAAVSPYLVALILPAAPVTLPLLAWWLDRRRQERKGPAGVNPGRPENSGPPHVP